MTTFDEDAALRRLAEAGLPHDGEEGPLFPCAWHARVFGLIIALVENKQVAWGTFQARLVSHLREHLSETVAHSNQAINQHYFDSWLGAAQETLVAEGFLADDELGGQEKRIREAVAKVKNDQIMSREA
ncbi:nitrile hydratase accessory protein [Mesorhizobium sp. B2-4-19]|uniref:nitrile hydratase accessory protein n=1 Tax=Mesorhizobium sp. B2-4-19 TaxID=2589930 RepID=UPI00112B84FD|nr:nitrile hydratase accessory protein [Mesorhizobium sp. B2-4-19]TPK59138.1 nitrile hydratase accessory protein [Mesorhizobium sp. B2-4-19]